MEYENKVVKICNSCKISQDINNFYKNGKYYQGHCKKCAHKQSNQWKSENKEKVRKSNQAYDNKIDNRKRLLIGAQKRAKDLQIPFNLEISDIIIPEFCPVLGLKLERNKGRKPGDNSPSLDRITPELGYIKDNVCVISWRANALKKNGTIEEFEKIINYIKSKNKSCTE